MQVMTKERLEEIKSKVHLLLQDLTHNELKDYFSNLIYGYDQLQQENKQLKEQKEELKKWLEGYFQGKTIDDIPVDDFYKKGMYRMMEYTLDKIKELEEGVK